MLLDGTGLELDGRLPGSDWPTLEVEGLLLTLFRHVVDILGRVGAGIKRGSRGQSKLRKWKSQFLLQRS